MKVLNDHNGEINGKVMLTYRDCEILNSALFYLRAQESLEEKLEEIRLLQGSLKAIMNKLGEDYDYGDYQGSFD